MSESNEKIPKHYKINISFIVWYFGVTNRKVPGVSDASLLAQFPKAYTKQCFFLISSILLACLNSGSRSIVSNT